MNWTKTARIFMQFLISYNKPVFKRFYNMEKTQLQQDILYRLDAHLKNTLNSKLDLRR